MWQPGHSEGQNTSDLACVYRRMAMQSNFRVRLLAGCDGLEHDVARFSKRLYGATPGDPTCRLCPETPEHFVAECLSLHSVRAREILRAPPTLLRLDFTSIVLGCRWIDSSLKRGKKKGKGVATRDRASYRAGQTNQTITRRPCRRQSCFWGALLVVPDLAPSSFVPQPVPPSLISSCHCHW